MIVVHSRWPTVALSLGLIGLSAGCLGSPRVVQAGAVEDQSSPKLLPFVYFEDGAFLFVGVDTRAAQYTKDAESMFPVGIGLGNRSRRTLSFDRESFVLETAAGQVNRLVSVREFSEGYKRSATDRELAGHFLEKLQIKFAGSAFRRGTFFPARGSSPVSTAIDKVELGTTDWTHMYLYFPRPSDGLHGRRFKLLVSAAGEPDPIVVAFDVR